MAPGPSADDDQPSTGFVQCRGTADCRNRSPDGIVLVKADETDDVIINWTEKMRTGPAPLLPWMRFVLRFAGAYNIVAGLAMMALYHEGYKLLGIEKPSLTLPVQLVGLLVGLFGIGYLMTAARPLQNIGTLRIGFLSKLLGPLLAVVFVVRGELPLAFLLILLLADLIYLPFFWRIDRRLQEALGKPLPGDSTG